MRHLVIASLAVACLLSAVIPCSAQTTRPRLAIMDFSAPSGVADRGYADSSRRFWGDPGRMMSELLTTHFAKSGRFDVVERARLYQLLNEKQITVGQGVLGDQAKLIGSELGVNAIVVGGYSPSAYGYEVSARVVSVADGSIMATENALIPADPAWMDQSMAILAGKLSAPWSKERGYVLDVFLESDKLPLLMVDLGTAQGARVGRKLEISTAGDPIIHPVTHENLGTRDVLLANAAIIQTQKEFSYARVMDRAGVTSTPIKSDAGGIDIGVERMQRVKLLDETTDTAPDADLSVLSVMKYVPINSDIPEAKLLVDGKPTPLSGSAATVRLGAGTHLVELQVGQLLLSREVTVTKQGVQPKEVAFRKDDLASAVAIKPPEATTPVQGTTVMARTAPEMTGDDRKADDRLLAMLPKPEVIDEQLKAARDEAVTSTFEAGLRALRFGYARGNRSYLSIAADRFREVTRLAPDVALGHFNLGLARFYLDQMDEAQSEFQLAIKLDDSLAEGVPLLWWEDFAGNPGGIRRLQSVAFGTVDSPEQMKTHNASARVRFRFVQPNLGDGRTHFGIDLRHTATTCVSSCITLGGEYAALLVQPHHDSGTGQYNLDCTHSTGIGPGWHVLEQVAHDDQHELWIDGRLIVRARDANSADWVGNCSLYYRVPNGPLEIDWVLVTRY
jgi:hypothetical protein